MGPGWATLCWVSDCMTISGKASRVQSVPRAARTGVLMGGMVVKGAAWAGGIDPAGEGDGAGAGVWASARRPVRQKAEMPTRRRFIER